ncbi:MAG: gluconate 5-dehydrogenase [Verrucomicrobia bacterium]|nr:MAG: gluconate 5-dehydrogenase [Verrucomicrobiota bacterium]
MIIDKLFSLKGKIALVTGSSRGLGFIFAQGLAEAGATVVLNGTNEATLGQAVEAMKRDGHDAHGRAFDISDSGACARNITAIESEIGPVGVLINNAGIQIRRPMHEFDDADWERIIKINLSSMYYVSKYVLPGMMERKAGKIINIGSVQSELGRPTIVPYTVTKGGVKMLTKGMAAEYGKNNIQVNGIGPGYFETELTRPLVEDKDFNAWLCARTPANRWGDPKELKGAAIFLASEASNYVNGHMLYVDGGLTACV